MIIGGSFYNDLSKKVAASLKDKAKVVHGANSSWCSNTALKNYNKLLGGKKWDLIFFNFGFNDIMYKDPTIREVRAMHKEVGGVQVTSLRQYEKNLKELVLRFKKDGAKVIWASISPIVGDNGILCAGDELKYNQVAAKVMKAYKIPIVDMHKHGTDSHKSMRHGKTFNYKNGKPLHPPIVEAILKELKLP